MNMEFSDTIAASLSTMFKRYILATGFGVVLLCVLVLAINSVIDPLWIWKGNQLQTNRNFIFNERLAKLNLFLKNASSYDCMLFGTSRATTLPAEKIQGARCFNMSFSGGSLPEFVAYAKYLKKRGFNPKKVILAIDSFVLRRQNLSKQVPACIENQQNPDGILKSYLSLDALGFSLRTLVNSSPLPRVYDDNFNVYIRDDAPKYHPKLLYPDNPRQDYYDEKALELVKQLFLVFPEAERLAYVPPISIWEMQRIRKADKQQNSIRMIYAVSQIAGKLYDFSLPSKLTSRTDNTFDGSHYNNKTNQLIVNVLNGKRHLDGVLINTSSFEDYSNLVNQRMELINRSFQAGKQAQGGCPRIEAYCGKADFGPLFRLNSFNTASIRLI
ncbi:MAG: hypothetical protein V3U88_12485 [Methylococcales bacterium]